LPVLSSPAPACCAAASPAPTLQALVLWALHRVLAEHRAWRFTRRAERWRLAGRGLRLVRLALLSAPSSPGAGVGMDERDGEQGAEGMAVIADAVAGVLRFDVGMAGCLFAALPYHAEQLEVGPG
jgi:hypothetical protein